MSRNNLLETKVGVYVIDLDDKKVKEHIGLHYLLTETQELEILLGIEYVPKEVLNQLKINQLLAIYLEYKMNKSVMCGFSCVSFIEYMLPGKTFKKWQI